MTNKQSCCLLVLASCSLVGKGQEDPFTLSCLDTNARPSYLEGTPGSHQCTITNSQDQNLEHLVFGTPAAPATTAWFEAKNGDGGDWAGFGGDGSPTIDWGSCAAGIPAFNTRTKVNG